VSGYGRDSSEQSREDSETMHGWEIAKLQASSARGVEEGNGDFVDGQGADKSSGRGGRVPAESPVRNGKGQVVNGQGDENALSQKAC